MIYSNVFFAKQILLLGPPNSGKSTLARHCLRLAVREGAFSASPTIEEELESGESGGVQSKVFFTMTFFYGELDFNSKKQGGNTVSHSSCFSPQERALFLPVIHASVIQATFLNVEYLK